MATACIASKACHLRRDRRRRSPGGHAARNKPPPAPMPEKPDLYGVYRGRVSNVLEFGCFVELQGLPQEGRGTCAH